MFYHVIVAVQQTVWETIYNFTITFRAHSATQTFTTFVSDDLYQMSRFIYAVVSEMAHRRKKWEMCIGLGILRNGVGQFISIWQTFIANSFEF